jgi:hypothetical protein
VSVYDQVYAEYMEKAKDPAWKLAMQIFIGELMQQNATYHQAQIQAIADWAMERQLNRYKTQITKAYLTERVIEIRKANATDKIKERFKEVMWERDESGQFARYKGPAELKNRSWTRNGQPIPTRERGVRGDDVKAVIAQNIAYMTPEERSSSAAAIGMLAKPHALPTDVSQAQHMVDVAHRFQDLTQQLSMKTGRDEDKQRVQFIISSPDGFHRVETPRAGTMADVKYEAGERVSFMTPVGADNPVTIAGQALNIGHVAGLDPESAAKASAVTNDINQALSSASWGERLQSTANALRVVSNNSPLAVQAHAVASLFNILGPSAGRAFGNKLKQLTYRYFGQEAPPERWSEVAQSGKQEGESTRQFEYRLMHDLKNSLPTLQEYNLALEAGSATPSRGYILDSEGRVVSEAVGYADDWYAPFNLKKMHQMRGGSYVRTRGFGGITPEDVIIAQRTGAKRVTVLSNNGMFTMEFEPKALHWGHRFGFGGGAMVRRYAKALDAVQNGAIEDSDGGPGQKLRLNDKGYVTAMRDLQSRYPYYIKAPQGNYQFHVPGNTFGITEQREKTGEKIKDLGYKGPLNIHANQAKFGWHDSNARDMFSDRQGKYAYDDVQREMLTHDSIMRVSSTLRGDAPAASSAAPSGTGSSYTDNLGIKRNKNGQAINEFGSVISEQAARQKINRDRRNNGLSPLDDENTSWSRTTDYVTPQKQTVADEQRAAAGAVSSERAYTPNKNWDEAKADGMIDEALKNLERIQQINGGKIHNLENYEYAGELFKTYTRGQGEPAEVKKKVLTDPNYRVKLADEIEELWAGRTNQSKNPTGMTMRPGEFLAVLRDEDPNEKPAQRFAHQFAGNGGPAAKPEADAPATDYTGLDNRISLKQLAGSDAVAEYIQRAKRKLRVDDGSVSDQAKKRAQEQLDEYDAYAKIQERLEKTKKVSFANPRERAFYERKAKEFAGVIQHGLPTEQAPGRMPDIGAPVVGARVQFKRVQVDELDRGTSAATIADSHYADLKDAGYEGEALHEQLRSLVRAYDHQAKYRSDRDGKNWEIAVDVARNLEDYIRGNR